MTTISILPHPEYCPQGATVQADPGTSICEALLEQRHQRSSTPAT